MFVFGDVEICWDEYSLADAVKDDAKNVERANITSKIFFIVILLFS
jgi:hypothetical protein